jgi:hypothetical protein
MNIVDKYLSHLNEGRNENWYYSRGSNFFHGSLTQNLKMINAQMDPAIKKPVVWGSYYRPFAAAFVLPYRQSRIAGHNCDPDCEYWIVEITKHTKKFLTKPCSLYTIQPVDGTWETPKKNMYVTADKTIITMGENAPGAYVQSNCTVIKEEKFRTVMQCFMKNMVGVVFVE